NGASLVELAASLVRCCRLLADPKAQSVHSVARFISPPDGERNRNDRRGLPRRALDENPCSSEKTRASMTAPCSFLTRFIFMVTSLECLVRRPLRLLIHSAPVFAEAV